MQVFYSPRYYADIGQSHIFPIRKFELVRDRLLADGSLHPNELVEPSPATIEQALLVHTDHYLSRLCSGSLTAHELRRLGLPGVQVLAERLFFVVGRTTAAAH